MSVDIFGRGELYGKNKRGRKGDPGVGFNYTNDGNYDMKKRD